MNRMEKKNIIFISYEFPPRVSGGTFRPLKFAKYLPEFGFRPYVYSLDSEYFIEANFDSKKDFSLLDELEGKDVVLKPVKIDSVKHLYRSTWSRFKNIYFNLYRGSEYKKWAIHLTEQVEKDHATADFKAVFVTAPPFGMLKLATAIAEKLKLPLILDMRDAWALWNTVPFGSFFHYLLTKKKEAFYFKHANKIIATTQQTIDDWLELHPALQKEKFACIPNGFDDENNLLEFRPFSSGNVTKDQFTITYVGSFYYFPDVRREMLTPFYKRNGLDILHYFPRRQDWLYRTPFFFFAAVNELFKKYPESKNKLRIRFAGHTPEWLSAMVNEFSLHENVEHLGMMSHKESLELQRNSDALLITSAKLEGGKDCFVAGKTFEYFTMGRPVLAFVSEGSQKDILAPSGVAVIVNPDDAADGAKKMHMLLTNKIDFTPDKKYLEQFDRRKLAGKLAAVLTEVIG